MIKIVFFAPYPEILPVIEQVFRERPESEAIQYEVVQDFYNNRLDSVEADVIIARGFTAHTLKKKSIPCAELKSTVYDVFSAVKYCMDRWDVERIAVVGAFNMVYGAGQISQFFPTIKVSCYAEDDETKLESAVAQALKGGCQAIVGGYSTLQIAQRRRVPAVMIKSGVEAVNNAISEAIEAARLTRYERERQAEIANIMNYSFQGIISVNRKGVITLANSYCYTLMRDRKASITGLDVREIFPGLRIEKVTQQQQKILSEVYEYGRQQVMVNCVPVEGESEDFGCVLTFKSVDQIQTEEGKLRRRMRDTGFVAKYHFSDILYRDKVMEAVIKDGMKFSYADSNVLIHGETGTGKELFAQSIHNSSRRRGHHFVAINCAALPENLLESELFGYAEGAFTGASKGGKMGFFEIAHEGTIFLDEIGDISPSLQSRLLRVLQEREIIRIGSDAIVPVDVRVICATNRNLKEEVKNGNFRQDLLYRLDVLELNIPPLRERREDITYLVDRMIGFEHARTGSVLAGISEEGKKLLKQYEWPGNVRELNNFCERICILCGKDMAGAGEVRQALPEVDAAGYEIKQRSGPETAGEGGYGKTQAKRLPDAERAALVDALERFGYHRGKTADYLGIDKSTLWRKMKKYGILGERFV